MKRKQVSRMTLVLGLAALIALLGTAIMPAFNPGALAASPIYVRPDGDDTNCDGTVDAAYTSGSFPQPCAVKTIQQGINLVDAGGTVYVRTGTYVLTAVVNVNKTGITLDGDGAGATIVQVSGTGYRFEITAAGVTLQDFEIVKTDKPGLQDIIHLGANSITIKNNTIHGQFVIGDGDVSRAMVVSGGLTGLNIEGNTIYALRQPAYVTGTTTGTVQNNYTYGTKGWVLEGGNLTFTGNTWGTGAQANVFDIAILATMPGAYYTDIVAMSNANNGAVIEDQRASPAVLSVVYVNAGAAPGGDGGQSAPYQTIQAGIDRVVPGGLVKVFPGTYSETAAGRYLFNSSGPYQFGLFVGQAKSGITVQGVDATGQAITAFGSVLATVNTNATNGFGPSGFFIEGDNVTFAGLRVGTNASGQNKTIEVIGDNFTLKDSDIADIDGSVYLNDWRFNVGTDTSHLQSYTIDGNQFQDGVSLDIASGAGYSGAAAGRKITDNVFVLGVGDYWPSISFTGSDTGVPWFVYSVGGAVITGNQFSGGDQIIRARGTYDNSQFDWASYWNNNTFQKAVVVGSNPPANLTTYSYISGPYTFNNVRRIGTIIQGEVDHAAAGDTVLVKNGTYEEAVVIDNKTLTLKGESLGAVVKSPVSIPTCTTTSYDWHPVICIKNGSTATVDTLTIDGAGRGNGNVRFMGVAFRNAGGAVKNSVIDNIEDTPFSGSQHGVGVNLYNDDAAARTLEVSNNTISDFQKNGMAITTGGTSSLVVDIKNNNVQGKGATTITAQNGIQVYRSGGTLNGAVTNNTVNGIAYDNTLNPIKYVATSILNFYAPVDVTGNTVTNGHMGIYNIDASGNVLNNNLTIVKVGVSAYGIVATDPPDAIPAPYEGDIAGGAATPESPSALLTVVVSNNTVAFSGGDNTDTFGIEADAGYGPDNLDVTINGNSVTGFDVGVEIWQCQSGCSAGVFTSVVAHNNCLSNNASFGLRSNASYITSNGDNNFWGAASGPYHPTQNPSGTGDDVSNYVDFTPWLTACTGGSSTGSWQNTRTGAYDDLQDSLDNALPGDTIRAAGSDPLTGGATANQPGVTIDLNGKTAGPGSPFLIVNAANVTVNGPGTLDGWTGAANSTSPAILVNSGGDNFILDGVQVKRWEDGVELAGSVTSFKLVNNWINLNTDAGLQVNSGVTLGGVVTIQGNLFKVNGGNGVQNNGATANLNVEYNSWGDLAGPTGTLGDGVGGSVDYTPWTFAETYIDVDPATGGDQYQRNVNQSTSFNVALNVEAANLYGLAFQFTYDPTYLTFNGPPTFSAPWSGSCSVVGAPPTGTFKYQCYLISGLAWNGGTVATFNFTANGVALTGDGPWTTYFDISHLETNTSAGAAGGVKVFVNNAGFNAPTTPNRDITDTNDGRIDITGIAQYTGFVDLQGRPNDSGAVMSVFSGSSKPGTAIAAATSASSGAYTTAYIGANLLTVGTTYYLYFDRPLYLPTTAAAASVYAHSKLLSTRPTTGVNNLILLGGDATDDNVVGIDDGTCIGNQYGLPAAVCGVGGLSSSDVNGDGTTNILDLVLFGGNYGFTASPWTP